MEYEITYRSGHKQNITFEGDGDALCRAYFGTSLEEAEAAGCKIRRTDVAPTEEPQTTQVSDEDGPTETLAPIAGTEEGSSGDGFSGPADDDE